MQQVLNKYLKVVNRCRLYLCEGSFVQFDERAGQKGVDFFNNCIMM
jgi:hypothetical protein